VSTTSYLFEQVDDSLLDERNRYSVALIDSTGQAPQNLGEVEVENPFDFDVSRFLPNVEVFDLPKFIEVAGDILEDAQKREGIVADERVKLKSAFPDEDVSRWGEEVIIWKVINRQPANLNKSGTGRPQRAPRYSYDLRSPSHPNKVIFVESRLIDHVVEFSCFSKNADAANRRALWLERLYITHRWAFKVQGADRFWWKDRGIDTYMTAAGGVKLYQRPLRFFVRLREFNVHAESILKHIEFELSVKNS